MASLLPPKNVMCVGAVVVSAAGCLFVQEAAGRLAGLWSIPWGFIEAEEAPDAAARRETREEAGVDISVTALLGMAALPNPIGAVGLVFRGEMTPSDQRPRPDGVETLDATFFSAGQLADGRLPIEPWCRWVVLRVLQNGADGIARATDGPSTLPTFL